MRKILLMLSIAITTIACNDKIEVQQIYDYVLQTMPVPSELEEGETAEIRCKLIKNGYYEDAHFTIRYFQTEGYGELRINNGEPLIPNDRYKIDNDTFNLYYTSRCREQQDIDIYIEDNFGQVQQYSYSFADSSVEKENE